MKRIAILGCENSHADAFLACIRDRAEFSDIEVVGIYSNESDAAARLHQSFGVPILEHYADAVGKIDGLVITARHGDNHYKYAAPYIDSGIPMFIDKPITNHEEEAILFMRELREHSVRISGGSSLKQDSLVQTLAKEARDKVGGGTIGGYVRAPYEGESPYGGFFFYAQHLIEIVCEIFGRHPASVSARKTAEQIQVIFHYEGYDVLGLFCNNNYYYHACLMSERGASGGEIVATGEWFEREFNEFCKLLAGGEQQVSYEEFIVPVFIMNAISRSLASGKEEKVGEVVL